jgi:hypothetical protein
LGVIFCYWLFCTAGTEPAGAEEICGFFYSSFFACSGLALGLMFVSIATPVLDTSNPTGPWASAGSLPPAGLGTSGISFGSSFGGSGFFAGGGGGSSFFGGGGGGASSFFGGGGVSLTTTGSAGFVTFC